MPCRNPKSAICRHASLATEAPVATLRSLHLPKKGHSRGGAMISARIPETWSLHRPRAYTLTQLRRLHSQSAHSFYDVLEALGRTPFTLCLRCISIRLTSTSAAFSCLDSFSTRRSRRHPLVSSRIDDQFYDHGSHDTNDERPEDPRCPICVPATLA